MKKLDKIYFDGISWNFSEYFEYLKGVEDEMPRSLWAFAGDIESYSLHGNKTLHDSRVLSLLVLKNYGAQFTDGKTSIELTLIDQLFEGRTKLSYEGVCSLLIRDPDQQEHGHTDVLLHEFSIVRPGVYRHQIVLDHGGEIHIEFEAFSHEWTRDLLSNAVQ